MMKYLTSGIIILLYVLMIGFTFNQLPRKLYSVDRRPYIIYQEENYYKVSDEIWLSPDSNYITKIDTNLGFEYKFSGRDIVVLDDSSSLEIYESDTLIGTCDYENICIDHHQTDDYDILYFQEFITILEVIEPNDLAIFKNANLQHFLLLETLGYVMMVIFLRFGLMRKNQAKAFLSSFKDYFNKIKFLQDVEQAKIRVFVLHRGSLILGLGILSCLIYVLIAIYML